MKKAHMLLLTLSFVSTVLTLTACRSKQDAPVVLNSVPGISTSLSTDSVFPLSTKSELAESTIPETTIMMDFPSIESTTESELVATSEQPTESVSIAPELSAPTVSPLVPQPETLAPPPPAGTEPTNSEPAYTEADYQTMIEEIRRYGETKGFVWNDGLLLGVEGIGYYGRPDLTNDGYDGVISMLKFHCNKIEEYYGSCYFKVIWQLYDGNIEFIVLYA